MISFRCWFCNRGFYKPDELVRQRFVCSCGQRVKVPKRSGGSSKAFSLADWFVESLVYGGAGALLGFLLCIAIVPRVPLVRRPVELTIAMTLFGLLAGMIFGERGINWIGQKIRDRENG